MFQNLISRSSFVAIMFAMTLSASGNAFASGGGGSSFIPSEPAPPPVYVTGCSGDYITSVANGYNSQGVLIDAEYTMEDDCSLSNGSECIITYIENWENPSAPAGTWTQQNFGIQDGCAAYGI